MARPGFWNDNRFRSYPFLKGEVGQSGSGSVENVPDNSIVDAGFIMGLTSGYVAGEHSIWLKSVSRSGDDVTFTFSSNAPGLSGKDMQFTLDVTSTDEYTIEYVEVAASAFPDDPYSDSYSYSAEGEICDAEPAWSGFIVSGRLVDLEAVLSDGSTWSGEAAIEPALVQSTVGSYVSSINVGNSERTRVTAAEGCTSVEWDYPDSDDAVHISKMCIRGDVRIKAGYNAAISQVDFNNQIEVSAEVGAGEGVPCQEVPLFDGEEPPDGSTLYTGGLRCSEVLRSINGIGGQSISFISGNGVQITPSPDQNKILLDINMNGLAVCYDEISAVSESV